MSGQIKIGNHVGRPEGEHYDGVTGKKETELMVGESIIVKRPLGPRDYQEDEKIGAGEGTDLQSGEAKEKERSMAGERCLWTPQAAEGKCAIGKGGLGMHSNGKKRNRTYRVLLRRGKESEKKSDDMEQYRKQVRHEL